MPALAANMQTGEDDRAHIIELVLNEGEPRMLVVHGEPGERTLIAVADWRRLRLVPPDTEPTPCDGGRCFALEGLPGLVSRYEPHTQRLLASAPPHAFEPTRRHYGPRRTPPAEVSPGMLVNYDLSAGHRDATSSAAVLADLSLFDRRGRLQSSGVWRQQGASTALVRLESYWQREWPEQMTRLTVGDSVIDPGSAGAPLRMAGVAWGSDFELQPDFITAPLLSASGSAALPSVVDVFIGQRRVAREEVSPGPFIIEDLPPALDAGELSVVVRDTLGRETRLTQPFHASPRLLRTGVTERALALGTLRRDFGTRSFRYDDVIASGRWRRGLTDRMTLGLGFAATGHSGRALGTEIDLRAGGPTLLRLETAASQGTAGFAGRYGASIERRGRRLTTSASLRHEDRAFNAPGQRHPELGVQPRRRALLAAGLHFGRRGSLSLTALRQSFHGETETLHSLRSTYSISRAPFGHLFVSAQLDDRAQVGHGFLIGWTRRFGGRRSAGLNLRPGDGSTRAHSARIRRTLPRGTGTGYEIELQSDGDHTARWSGRHARGRWRLETGRRNGRTGLRASASGSLLRLEQGWHLSRRVHGGFAVVDLAGLEGVTVFSENQPVAVTDAQGRAVVADLRPYQRNRLSIDPEELPLSVEIGSPRRTVAPRARTGVRVEFPLRRLRHAVLRLRLADGRPVPAGAVIEPETLARPVGHHGRVYLAELAQRAEPPARTRLEAQWPGGRCWFELDAFEDGQDTITQMGTVPCHVD